MKLSRHALEQARQRGVSVNEISKAIQMGAKHLQAEKIVSDFMHIRVVYKIINKEPFVITVMVRR
jgi:hypothetical protein